jgi:glucose-fructose oxidoreductase
MKVWRVVGINFDHMHMGDLLRMVLDCPRAELVGVSDENPQRVWPVLDRLNISRELFFGNYRECIESTGAEVAVLCPATAEHADCVEKVAGLGVHVLVEKPFAATLSEADRMIAAMKKAGRQLAINWPLRWYRSHVKAKQLCDEGVIGEVLQVHYYDGNRGPMRHVMDKAEISEEEANRQKAKSWFYDRGRGGGSMLDYLGYGTTLGTWYLNGKKPIEVTAVVDQPAGLEVDEHAIAVARYDTGLSKFETRWGTFSDPWTHQPQPKCGFVLTGREGTISSYDYENAVRVQTAAKPEGIDVPAEELKSPESNPIEYFLDRLESGREVDGPLSPAIARIGQQIVDTAYQSAMRKRTLALVGN